MLVPLTWLADYVPLPPSPADLIERLTLAGLESGGVRVVGLPIPEGLRVKPDDATPVWDRDKIVVAKVIEIAKVPGADKLKFVTVDYGAGTPKTVITGAPNIAPGESGQKVILGLRGCRYYFQKKADEPKTVVTLEPRKLMGHDNDAMCMSNFELGIADDHDGIILLDDTDAVPGTAIADVLGDIIVELDVLPNMARCLAMLGIAREVAALTGATVTEPDLGFPTIAEKIDGKVSVVIADSKLCPRYSATLIRGAKIGPAPRWMRSRLHSAGLRPISNVVDVTNYVMLEYGQPLHAFDYDVLVARAGGKPPTIAVRPAMAGETLKTLDGQVRELGPDHLVIADMAGPIALAGVMGGAETEVTAATTTILLEAASFDPVSVRKTARQFTLFSEASTRFSRGVASALVEPAAKRAAQLLHRYAGGAVLTGVIDNYPAPPPPRKIELNRTEIERVLGVPMPDGEVERVLLALQFTVEPSLWGWTVTPPATRLDIQAGPADLIEDLARVSGYDRLPSRLLAQELPPQTGNPGLELEEKVRDLLIDAGVQEVICYSLTGPAEQAKLLAGLANPVTSPAVALLNPVSPDRSILRQSLLPGVLVIAAENLKASAGVALFEIGPVFLPKPGQQLPDEPRRLALVLSGRRTVEAWDDPLGTTPPAFDFFDLKGLFEGLAADLHVALTVSSATDVPHLHPGRAARLLVNGTPIGAFGELHPKVAAAFKLTEKPVIAGELDLDAFLAAIPPRFAYRPLSTFPPILRDVAVVIDASVTAAAVQTELLTAGGDLLESARLFDVYRGDSIPPGTKSLAYALTYRRPDRQLTDKEVDKAHQKIEGRLVHVLKATIRGK